MRHGGMAWRRSAAYKHLLDPPEAFLAEEQLRTDAKDRNAEGPAFDSILGTVEQSLLDGRFLGFGGEGSRIETGHGQHHCDRGGIGDVEPLYIPPECAGYPRMSMDPNRLTLRFYPYFTGVPRLLRSLPEGVVVEREGLEPSTPAL